MQPRGRPCPETHPDLRPLLQTAGYGGKTQRMHFKMGTTGSAADFSLAEDPSLKRRVEPKEEVLLEQILGPDDAVDGLGRRVSYGTPRERFLSRLRLALVAFSQTLRSQG